MYESLPIKVTLIVEVDGHRLEFAETGKATGARGVTDGHLADALEENIRGTVDTSIARAHHKAMDFVGRAWADVVVPLTDGS